MVSEKLYLLLEIEKVKQNHKNIPTTYLYPLKGLAFSCCTYGSIEKTVFHVFKKKIENMWEIKFLNKTSKNLSVLKGTDTLYESIKSAVDFLEKNDMEFVEADIGLWANSNIAKEGIKYTKEYNLRFKNNTDDIFEKENVC